jgi:hypothetical protein
LASFDLQHLPRRFAAIYTGAITDVLDGVGFLGQTLPPEITPLRPGMRLAGPAYPIEGRPDPAPEYDTAIRKVLEMLGQVPPGHVRSTRRTTGAPPISGSSRWHRSRPAAAREPLLTVAAATSTSSFETITRSSTDTPPLRTARIAGSSSRTATWRWPSARSASHPATTSSPTPTGSSSFRETCFSRFSRAREVAAARERALRKAEQALARIEGGLGGRHYKTKAQVDRRLTRVLAPVEGLLWVESGERDGRPTLRWRRDERAIAQAALTDGLSALATNLPGHLGAGQLLRVYKQQWRVERRHRDLKQTLRVRPIFLHNDDRIEALVSVVGLTLLVFGLIESELRRQLDDEKLPALLPEGRSGPPTARSILAAFQGLGLTYTTEGIVLDRLTPTQRRILELLEIEAPWREQESLAAWTAEDGASSIRCCRSDNVLLALGALQRRPS